MNTVEKRNKSVLLGTTGWTVWGLNPGGVGFSTPVQTSCVHPASYTMSTVLFLEGKAAGALH